MPKPIINSLFPSFECRKGIRPFPKPYRGIERRSVSDEEFYEQELRTSEERKRNTRAMIGRNNRVRSTLTGIKTNKLIDSEDVLLSTPEYDEFTDVLSSRAQVQVTDEKKEEIMESWMKRLHFVTIPIHQFGNWIPLVTSRWYCSGHGCGFDQVSFEKKAGETIKLI